MDYGYVICFTSICMHVLYVYTYMFVLYVYTEMFIFQKFYAQESSCYHSKRSRGHRHLCIFIG